MLLKTRKALPKFRLYRKFKIDFFDLFSRGARVSRRYSFFYVYRQFRYKFKFINQVRSYSVHQYLQSRIYRFFYRRIKRVVRRFSLLRTRFKRKYLFFARRLINNVVISNSNRSSTIRNLFNSPLHFNSSTPSLKRLGVLYNFKKN